MKTAPFRCVVVYAVWVVIFFGLNWQRSQPIFYCDEAGCFINSLGLVGALFAAAILAFISYVIWQKLDPDPLWGDGESEVDDPIDPEYNERIQKALRRRRDK